MLVDFKKTFKNKSQKETKLPDAMIRHLSKSLPQGTRYISDNHGNCKIISEEGYLVIGGIILTPSKEDLEILGENFTENDLYEYAYNSQRKIPVKLKKEGKIMINNSEISIDELSFNPLNPVRYVEGSFLMIPAKFPKPFSIKVSNDKYECELLIHRVPNKSINIALYESNKDKPLKIQYFVDEKNNKISFNISYNLSLSSNVKDLITATSIYNSFAEGKAYLNGKKFNAIIDTDNVKKYDKNSLIFWEKVLELEQVLNVQFSLPENNVEYNEIKMVEELYQYLIQKKPVREVTNVESLTGIWDLIDNYDIEETIGKAVYFEFEATSSFLIFNQEIILNGIICIFDACLSDLKIDDNKYTLFLENHDEKNMYISKIFFSNMEQLQEYKTIDNNHRLKEMQAALSVEEYIESN